MIPFESILKRLDAVMKKIATLEGIPRNDELRLTDRAAKLMNEVSFDLQSRGMKLTTHSGRSSSARTIPRLMGMARLRRVKRLRRTVMRRWKRKGQTIAG
jgi:hypothetical protein